MNIVLIGYRGAGKSAVGKKLAERLRREFVDLDDFIEKQQGAMIRDLVESHGWEHFRAVERRAIGEMAGQDSLIVAPGGGAVLDGENVKSLKRNGLVIWLRAGPEVLSRRMMEDPRTLTSRPTLTGKGSLEELDEVLAVRNRYYEKAADVEIDTSDLDVEGVVGKILNILGEQGSPPGRGVLPRG